MNGIASDEIPTAIGSTEPTAEEKCHWTPEMKALAARDGVTIATQGCSDGPCVPTPAETCVPTLIE